MGLESKISEAKTKKDMLKARASAAKANEQLQSTMGQLNTNSAMGAFERMEEKVLMMEAKSQAAGELAGADLESQFAALEAGGDVDDELAAMKAQLAGGSVDQAALPEGEAPVAAPKMPLWMRSWKPLKPNSISCSLLLVAAPCSNPQIPAQGLKMPEQGFLIRASAGFAKADSSWIGATLGQHCKFQWVSSPARSNR
jgi:hypothetical protein